MESQRLEYVAGTRFVASLWIVCQHFSPHSSHGELVKVLWRSNVGVDYFIVLSGFVTHWGKKKVTRSWFVRRFGRVLTSTYVSMVFAIIILALQGAHLDPGHVARCFLLVEPWWQPNYWCPNGQIWTVAALVPAWLAYPLLRPGWCLGVLALVMPCVTLAMLGRPNPNPNLHEWLYLWPPAQFLDFVLGTCCAELAKRHGEGRGWVADAAFLFIVLVCFFFPNPRMDYRSHWEVLFDHCLAPFFGMFLYAAARGNSLTGRFFSHPALAALGDVSFQVYLFQWPVHASFQLLGLPTQDAPENFIAFVLFLWVFAALYEYYLERPFVTYLRRQDTAAYQPLILLHASRGA